MRIVSQGHGEGACGQEPYLESLLVLLGLGMVDLLDSPYVILEIDHGMLPRLESFREEAGGLRTVSVRLR